MVIETIMLEEQQHERNFRAERGRALADTPNAVRKIPAITKWQLWKVKSQSSKGIVYTVVEKDNGELECDCPDFGHRHEVCKHIYAIIFSEASVQ